MAVVFDNNAYWKFNETRGNAAGVTANANTPTNTNTITYSTGLLSNDYITHT